MNSPLGGRVQIRILFSLAGWFLAAVLACWVVPRAYQRLITRMPAVQRENWNREFAAKTAELAATRWQDMRPLHILAGDSHIERGNWYHLFDGAYAVRNCGLSRATIQDVTSLVGAVPDRQPATVVLLCGINNLGANDAVTNCRADYEQLLQTTRTNLQPGKILVLSVMPVRASVIDEKSRAVNESVRSFNRSLQELCAGQQAIFVNIHDAVADEQGGLSERYTADGLHLNQEAYKKVAGVLRGFLTNDQSGK